MLQPPNDLPREILMFWLPQNSFVPFLLRMAFGFLALQACLVAQVNADVTASGVTHRLLADGTYAALPGVEIQVYRNGDAILPEPIKSKQNGEFKITIAQGIPFELVFFRPDGVPEHHPLAGKDGTENKVNVTLLTNEQSEAFGIDVSQKIRMILQRVRNDDYMSIQLSELPTRGRPNQRNDAND